RWFSIPLPLWFLSLIIVHRCWFSAPHRAPSLLLCSSPCLVVVGGSVVQF
ncbi:hypothetical protein S83_066750, partial [Arachis hypogaea]